MLEASRFIEPKQLHKTQSAEVGLDFVYHSLTKNILIFKKTLKVSKLKGMKQKMKVLFIHHNENRSVSTFK